MRVRKDPSPLKYRALHNLSTLPVEINLLKQPMLARDTDFKCMCNYVAFKRRDNKTLSRQRLISGSVSIAPASSSISEKGQALQKGGSSHANTFQDGPYAPSLPSLSLLVTSSLRLRMSQA